MNDNITGKVKLPPLVQIGMVVKDIDKVIEFYSSTFGIGPWQIRQGNSIKAKHHDQIYKYNSKVAFAKFGPITLELFEVRDGRSPIHSEFLDKGREGVHHFGFQASKEEKEQITKELVKNGMEIFQEGQTSHGSYVFFDTEKTGGLFFELFSSEE